MRFTGCCSVCHSCEEGQWGRTGKDATRALVRLCLILLLLGCTEREFLYPHPLSKCLNFGRKISNFFVNEIFHTMNLSNQEKCNVLSALETQIVKLKNYSFCKPLGFIIKVGIWNVLFGIECACSTGQILSFENCPIPSPGVVFIKYCDYTDPMNWGFANVVLNFFLWDLPIWWSNQDGNICFC